MTSNNHSAVACSVAIFTKDLDLSGKCLVVAALVISHLIFDAIPHRHYYGFDRLRQTLPGALVELGLGFVIMPLITYWFTGVNLYWIYICTFGANLFDFGVAAGLRPIIKLNDLVHWWYKYLSIKDQWSWEFAQTILVTLGLICALGG